MKRLIIKTSRTHSIVASRTYVLPLRNESTRTRGNMQAWLFKRPEEVGTLTALQGCRPRRPGAAAIRSATVTVGRATAAVWRDIQWGDFRFKPRHGYSQLALTPLTPCPHHDNE
jgi:hypothetical protein